MASRERSNRFGFVALGLANNFAYVVMLAAAYDLLKHTDHPPQATKSTFFTATGAIESRIQNYCNPLSTSTILLADTIPSLIIKVSYPFLLFNIPASHKVLISAALTTVAFLVTGFASREFIIFTGVVCASLASGLGESTLLSNTAHYGDAALSGWSIGTGFAGLLGAVAYALLKMILPIKFIMLIMLVVPVTMLVAYFKVIEVVRSNNPEENLAVASDIHEPADDDEVESRNSDEEQPLTPPQPGRVNMSLDEKLSYLPVVAKYFLPLMLVYFAEYFINQGLFELVYFSEMRSLDHAAQYRWFQVSYQLGVLISRSSLDILKIKKLWLMSMLQAANAVLLLAHCSKLIHIPNFYVVISFALYEGLLGGFTYVNTYHRIKTEIELAKQEFSTSLVTTADSFGIVLAGAVALPVHDRLCRLY